MEKMTKKPTCSDPEQLFGISRVVIQAPDWKTAFDRIAQQVRNCFIFDNIAVYLSNEPDPGLDVLFARAVGRGRAAAAELSWGEAIANRVLEEHQYILQEPPPDSPEDRLQRPYLLAFPLRVGEKYLGALVFIRFGGPAFVQEDVALAEFIANQVALLVERQKLQQEYRMLQDRHQQALLQEDFVSTITHEIRNPLGFIKGYTTTLLRSDTSWDAETQREFLEIIDRETDHLQELIENLLDSARLQAGLLDLKFQPVRLDALINDIILRAHLHYPETKVRLEDHSQGQPIQANPRRLAQVFENLISNAVKYAPGSDILIRLDEEPETIWIRVQDFGPGIDPEYTMYLFNRFFRVPNQPPNVRGSGLGLYICKQIITAHAGSITVESELNQGTTFKIGLPRATNSPSAAQNQEREGK